MKKKTNSTVELERSLAREAEILGLVKVWNVSPPDAEKAVDSAAKAWGKHMRVIFGGVDVSSGSMTPAELETALIAGFSKLPTELLKTLVGCPDIGARMQADPTAFFEKLANISSLKRFGPHALLSLPEWQFLAPVRWSRYNVETGIPPMCLMTDSAIRFFFDVGDISDEVIRQTIRRMGFYRPQAPRYGLESHGKGFRLAERHGGQFVA